MKIQTIEAIPLKAELSKPFRFANITRTRSANVVVRIRSDDGIVGWGEACPVPQLTSETQQSVVEIVEQRLAPILTGRDPRHREQILAEIALTNYGIDFTTAAVDSALLDMTGKAAGLPVKDLLGGGVQDNIHVHGSVGWEESPAAVGESAAQAAKTFTWLKLYAGRGTLQGDLERIESARVAVGEGHPFLIDVNGLWTPTDVARAAPRLEAAGVLLIEQPVHPKDYAGNATATRILLDQHGIDVAADESVRTAADVALVSDTRAASVINVGLSKLGGITNALRTIATARAHGLGVMVGGVVELGLANAAGLHLAAAAGDTAAPAYLMGPLKYVRQITSPTIEPLHSHLAVPSGPGLGVEVDEEAIRALDLRAV